MKTAIFIYENITALDAVGPYDVLSRLKNSEIIFVGLEKKEYKDFHGLKLVADYSIDEINEADILLIPGGFGIDSLLNNKKLLEWIQKIDKNTKWTVSVCSGSLLLAQCGLLKGKKCTTHWKRKNQLNKFDVNIINERYVQDGKIITSAGVSAGIDMALFLAGKIEGDLAASIIQLAIEYDPNPPYDCGSLEKASPEIIKNLNLK